jgi:hypothetical protein
MPSDVDVIPRNSIGEFAVAAPTPAPLRGKNGELVDMFCAHTLVLSTPQPTSALSRQNMRVKLFIGRGERNLAEAITPSRDVLANLKLPPRFMIFFTFSKVEMQLA